MSWLSSVAAGASAALWRCAWQPTVGGALLLDNLAQLNLGGAEQIRGRKRNRKRQATKEERLRRRLAKEEKEAERKRFTYIERIKMKMQKGKRSFSVQWPGRYDASADLKKDQREMHGIYLIGLMRTQFHPIGEALDLYRRLSTAGSARSDMLMKLRIELNMGTEKATKFVPDSRQLIVLPHPFKHREKRTILAFAGTKELQQEAMAAGADIALGPEMVKRILKGHFVIDDYDFCVAQQDMAPHILPLRGVIKTRFPTKINGGIGENVVEIVKQFMSGINLVVRRDPTNDQWGLCETLVGRLNQPNEEIEANLGLIVSTLCRQRNPALGKFINRCCLMPAAADPNDRTFFPIDVSPWEPEPTEQEKARVEKNSRKKKKATKTTMDNELDENDLFEDEEEGDEDDEDEEGGEDEEEGRGGDEKEKKMGHHPFPNLVKLDRKLLLEVM